MRMLIHESKRGLTLEGFDPLRVHHLGHCKNRPKEQPEGPPDDPPALDSDLSHQFLQDSIAASNRALLDASADPGSKRFPLLRTRAGQLLLLHGRGQFRVAGAERTHPFTQRSMRGSAG